MTAALHIGQTGAGKRFALPIEVAGEAIAILAKRGAGKTNTAKVVVEEVLDTGHVQVIVLDPVGVWWGLRSGADGSPRGGYDIIVFGGSHGDVPLEPAAGRLLAEVAVDSGQSMILDVSGLETDGAMQRFVLDFAERLYTLKASKPTPLLLVLEEGDEFAPQDSRGTNTPRMIGAIARAVKRGRSRGMGVLVITQRSAALNKNVLDQADTLVVMRTIGPRDRAAIEGWIKHQQAKGADLVLPSLPGLKTGEAWFWTPERALLEQVKVRKAATFDSSATPKAGASRLEAQVKPINVEKLGDQIRATAERAKENDPKALKRRIAELEKGLGAPRTAGTTNIGAHRAPDPAAIEARIQREVAKAVAAAERPHVARVAALERVITRTRTAAEKLLEALDLPVPATDGHRPPVPAPTTPRAERLPVSRPARPAREPRAPVEGISGPMRRMLDSLATLEQDLGRRPAERDEAAALARYRPGSGHVNNTVADLVGAGLASIPQEGWLELTDAGRGVATAAGLATLDELHDLWLGLCDGPMKKLLAVLLEVYPDEISRDETAERAGYQPGSGHVNNTCGDLVRIRATVIPRKGYLRANDLLFPEGLA